MARTKNKGQPRILVVDDEPDVGMIFHRVLGEAGYEVVSSSSGADCLRAIQKQAIDMVFLDLRMPGIDGLETLRRLRETHRSLPVVIMTAFQTVNSAVESMKLGAYDYMIKPLDKGRLNTIVRHALELGEAARKAPQVPESRSAETVPPEEVVAEGPDMRKVMERINRVAPLDMTVLILGESGTGKEVTARTIHRLSTRRKGPFVVVDCAALPESLIESELFGYEKGAFTGADSSRVGRFESADGGTLFLDEIGNLPLSMQAKLLRFLQQPQIERLGSRKGPITLDVRILAATNVDLEKGVAEGTFREDLYHRLKVFPIELPPLRNRGPEDLEALIHRILDDLKKQLTRPDIQLSPEALSVMKIYAWPGNIRELQNALRSAALVSEGVILPAHFPPSVQGTQPKPRAGGEAEVSALNEVLEKVERDHIANVLRRFAGDAEKTAQALGLDVTSLINKIKQHNLPIPPVF